MLFHRSIESGQTESAVKNMEQILFGKYTVLGLLGVGANGRVYLARHQTLEQERAIKSIPKTSSGSSSFYSEAELLKSLRHPGIPLIYDIEEDENNYYIVEEYVRGESLEAFVLHQKKISLNFFLQIGKQLCDIIGYLHMQPIPIIYQDLKPEHIILYDNQVKIVDFGIASYISKEGNPYQSYGTVRFAAPEKQEGGRCDERTDIFGIGAVLHFLETHLDDEPYSKTIRDIVAKAMATEPDRRYASAKMLWEQLEQVSLQENNKQENIICNHDSDNYREKKHLANKNLAVVGMRAGIGATHLAVSYNVYLNAMGQDSLYMEQNRTGDLRHIGEHAKIQGVRWTEDVSCGHFRGTASFRRSQEWIAQGHGFLIRDFGAYELTDIELELCEGILLVLGGRVWERQQAEWLYQKLHLQKHVIPVVNYGDEQTAKEYAKHWRKRVYCFPLDANPMVLTEEKRAFFETLQRKEGW